MRTARLVATAVARRTGVPETMLDEVRLAVGEACSRAVEAHQAAGQSEPVRLTLRTDPGRLEIEVLNVGRAGQGGGGEGAGEGAPKGMAPQGLSLAVIAGLADDVKISQTAAGTSVLMSWPVPAEPGAESSLSGHGPVAAQ